MAASRPVPSVATPATGPAALHAYGEYADFAIRVIIAVAIVAGALLIWKVQEVFLLLFAAILVTVILRAASAGLRRFLPIGDKAGLALAGFLILILLVGAFVLFGGQISAQATELADRLPAAWTSFTAWIGHARVEDLADRLAPSGSTVASLLQTMLSSVSGILSALILAVLGGIYLAVDPELYRKGALLLMPRPARPAVDRTMIEIGRSLRGWLVAQLLAMAVVGTLTYVGLLLVGVPSALALGLLAALLEFVPVAGPIMAAVPGLLIAMTVDLKTAGLALLVYVVIQQIEGNILAPIVMRHAVNIPPAVTLFALFLFGALFGVAGILLGGPLTVAVFVAVRMLWLREGLHEPVTPQPD